MGLAELGRRSFIRRRSITRRRSMAATGVVIGVGAARSAIVGPTTGAVFRFTAIRIRVWLSAGALDITAPLLSEEGCARQHVA